MLKLTQALRSGLAVKLAAYLIVSTGAIFLVFGVLNIRMHRSHAEALLRQNADSVSDLILRSTRYHMLRNDRDAIQRTVADLGSEPGMNRVRIASPEGIIRYSNDLSEIGKQTRQAAPPAVLASIERAANGDRILDVERPIFNQPNCSSTACHEHPASQKVLGAIDTHLSLAAIDREMKAQQDQLLRFTFLAMLLILLASVVFVFLVVHRRVTELKTGTKRVAGGDLAYRLPAAAHDELGELAESFNKMTAELDKARRELIERTQNSLIQSEKMASLGKLSATVAHELNNPLFGILTYARLAGKQIRASDLAPEERERLNDKLGVIERESRRCGEIVRNLMAFARQAPHKVASCNLNTVIERGVAVVRHRLSLQSVTLEKTLDPNLPEVVLDEGQIQQVVLVLLVNAIEAMPGGGALSVSSAALDPEHVVIRVRDTGSGIPAEVMPHIFEPFFTTKADSNGSGLGLAIAHGIIAQHGGDIEASSVPGEGTEFAITLPVKGGVRTDDSGPRLAVVSDVAQARNAQGNEIVLSQGGPT